MVGRTRNNSLYASCIKSNSHELTQSTLILCALVPTINMSIIAFCFQVFEWSLKKSEIFLELFAFRDTISWVVCQRPSTCSPWVLSQIGPLSSGYSAPCNLARIFCQREEALGWSNAHLLKGSALLACDVLFRSQKNQPCECQIQCWRNRKLLTRFVLFDLVWFVGLF